MTVPLHGRAIKILPAGISADPDRRARFEREAKIIAGLAHPHICTLHDIKARDERFEELAGPFEKRQA